MLNTREISCMVNTLVRYLAWSTLSWDILHGQHSREISCMTNTLVRYLAWSTLSWDILHGQHPREISCMLLQHSREISCMLLQHPREISCMLNTLVRYLVCSTPSWGILYAQHSREISCMLNTLVRYPVYSCNTLVRYLVCSTPSWDILYAQHSREISFMFNTLVRYLSWSTLSWDILYDQHSRAISSIVNTLERYLVWFKLSWDILHGQRSKVSTCVHPCIILFVKITIWLLTLFFNVLKTKLSSFPYLRSSSDYYLTYVVSLIVLQVQFCSLFLNGLLVIFSDCGYPHWLAYLLMGYSLTLFLLFGNFYMQSHRTSKEQKKDIMRHDANGNQINQSNHFKKMT